MNEFEHVPEMYEADTDEFNELYVVAWTLILQSLMRLVRLPQYPTNQSLLTLERQISAEVGAIFTDLSRKAVSMSNTMITEGYMEGVNYTKDSLSQENKVVQLKPKQLNDSHTERLNKMIEQTQSDLLKATQNTENNVKQLVRKVVSKEMADMGRSRRIGKQSNMAKRIEQQLREQFIQNGIKDANVAIIDRAKRKWRLETYSSMVARTKMNMAYMDAVREESLQNGSDLAIISTKPDTYDACLNYEGMIISLNGLTAGYLTYDQIKATKLCFHPNCGHFVRPVGSLGWVPSNLLRIHEQQMAKYNSNSR